LHFDINASSIPDFYKKRLLRLSDQRITRDGVIVIKAQEEAHRSREKNREAALRRLQEFIKSVAVSPEKRRPTQPTRSSRKKRLDRKSKRGRLKVMRGKIAG